MKDFVHFSERSIYRMWNVVLLAGIALFGVGDWSGRGFLWWLMVMGVFCSLMLFDTLKRKGRILFGLVLGATFAAVGIVAGLDKICLLFRIYGRWLACQLEGRQFEPAGESDIFRELQEMMRADVTGTNLSADVLNETVSVNLELWSCGCELLHIALLLVICYVIQYLLEKDVRIKGILAACVVAGMAGFMLSGTEVSRLAVIFAVCYVVMVVTQWTQFHWKKVKIRSMKAYMNWMAPFLSLYLLMLMAMPVSSEPYDWKFFKDTYNRISGSLERVTINLFQFGREDFDTALSGFSEDGGLGGLIERHEGEIMSVQGDRGLRTNLYLTGKVYDTFDGRSWTQTREDFSKERYADSVRTLYAAQRFDSQYQQDYLQKTQLTLEYRNFRSRYLFAPLKLWSLEQKSRTFTAEESEGSFLFTEKAGYGTEYEASFYQLNMGQESFYEFLEAAFEPDEVLLAKTLYSFNSRTKAGLTEEDLELQEQLVYEYCLKEPAMSEEAKAYLAGIVAQAETDVEKLRAIEKELSSYTYTLSPGKLPETVVDEGTFLDHFLLDSRQGYCSHFASAFVLLARAEGIPARFVQGYCVPMRSEEEVLVTSNMAHAWPEVYLDEIGWIPFEPTPGYAEIRYVPWAVRKDMEVSFGTETEMEEDFQENELLADMEREPVQMAAQSQNHYGLAGIGRIVGLAVLGAVAAGVILLMMERMLRKLRYRKLAQEEKYLVEMRKCLRLLSWLGFGRQGGETLEEMQRRIIESEKLDMSLEFITVYEEYLYGSREVDEELIQSVREAQEQLWQLLRKQKGRKYWYYRIFAEDYRR